MSTETLNIDRLFEELTISEIGKTLHEMRKNIEKEKEGMRLMVSERYRGLISAADSIVSMHERAQSFAAHVNSMDSGCACLHQQGLVGFQSLDQADVTRSDGKRHMYDIGWRLKLLLDLPDIVCSILDDGRLLNSALLFLLAQYIYLGVDTARVSCYGREMCVFDAFPVVVTNWADVDQLSDSIVSSCDEVVRAATMQCCQQVCESVVARAVLVGGMDDERACDQFLALRSEALLDCLCAASSSDKSTEGRLAGAASIVLHTVQLVYSIFTDGTGVQSWCGSAGFSARLAEVAETRPFSLLPHSHDGATRYLSPDIQQFRPVVSGRVSDGATMKTRLNQWLSALPSVTRTHIHLLLEDVCDVGALSRVRDAVYRVLAEDEYRDRWSELSRWLNVDCLCIWNLVFRDAVVCRARALLQSSINILFDQLVAEFKHVANDPQSLMAECDIVEFRWLNHIVEPAVSLSSITLRSMMSQPLTGVGARYKGYPPAIQHICTALNGRLMDILKCVCEFNGVSVDGSARQTDTRLDNVQPAPFDRWQDASSLRESLRDCVCEKITSLCDRLSEACDGGDSRDRALVAVLAARLSRATCHLVPLLPACLDIRCTNSQLLSDEGRVAWQRVCEMVMIASGAVLEPWISHIVMCVCDEMRKRLQQLSPSQLLSDFTTWSICTIADDNNVQDATVSTVSVPLSPRLSLSHALQCLCTSINHIGSLTLGSEIQRSLVERCVTQLARVYTDYYERCHSNSADNNVSQVLHSHQHALQSLFDVAVLRAIVATRASKELLNTLETLRRCIERLVDPIDLSIGSSLLRDNVVLYCRQTQALFGSMYIDGARAVTESEQKSYKSDHSVMPVSNGAVRFSLMPVPERAATSPFTTADTTDSAVDDGSAPSTHSKTGTHKKIMTSTLKLADSLRPHSSFLTSLSGGWLQS